jgi:hypothetical protein
LFIIASTKIKEKISARKNCGEDNMTRSHRIIFLSDLEESQGKAKPPIPYPFKENSIVSDPVRLVIRQWGAYLNVCLNTTCVLYHPNGDIEERDKGGMIYDIEDGVCSMIFVDKREFTQTIAPITTTSRDGWIVTLNINVTWKVKKAAKIVEIKDPIQRFIEQVRTTVIEYVQLKEFDELTTMPGGRTLYHGKITTDLKQMLRADPSLGAYEIIALTIRDRTGDPRITEKKHNGILLRTETSEAQETEINRLRQQILVIAEEIKVIKANEFKMEGKAHSEVKPENKRENFAK